MTGHQLRTIAITQVQEDYPTRFVGVAAWEAGLYDTWTQKDYNTAYWIWEQAVKDWELKLVEYLLNLPEQSRKIR